VLLHGLTNSALNARQGTVIEAYDKGSGRVGVLVDNVGPRAIKPAILTFVAWRNQQANPDGIASTAATADDGRSPPCGTSPNHVRSNLSEEAAGLYRRPPPWGDPAGYCGRAGAGVLIHGLTSPRPNFNGQYGTVIRDLKPRTGLIRVWVDVQEVERSYKAANLMFVAWRMLDTNVLGEALHMENTITLRLVRPHCPAGGLELPGQLTWGPFARLKCDMQGIPDCQTLTVDDRIIQPTDSPGSLGYDGMAVCTIYAVGPV